ncbi:hypothetical protein HK099_002762 [Clydaea vesicula]|uniref:protein-serine/threonine phosphatase n=1 Tax=Clydaea vesicula TaxID=447962 RepID=A0AAD5TSQ5_9FUNG|nr:hypothetical protein HK099_002762 [Clydaea vesicula]
MTTIASNPMTNVSTIVDETIISPKTLQEIKLINEDENTKVELQQQDEVTEENLNSHPLASLITSVKQENDSPTNAKPTIPLPPINEQQQTQKLQKQREPKLKKKSFINLEKNNNNNKTSVLNWLFCCFHNKNLNNDNNQSENNNSNRQEMSSKNSNINHNNSLLKYSLKSGKHDKKYLLPAISTEELGKKCLVLDLDETLVHSSFKPVAQADFVIPVDIDNQIHNVYVLKRPGVDLFLQKLGPQFEIVVFTASLAKYADPVLDMLDKHKVVKHRLFRESCIHHKGNYVKDLSQLGRELKSSIIIDNSPASYVFHPTNAIPISSWFSDTNDTELFDLIPFLEDLKMVENVMMVLDNSSPDN